MTRPVLSTILRRLTCQAACVVAALAFAATPGRAQTPQTFTACYVPTVGAIYLIKFTGLPTACLASGHVAFSWSESGSLTDGSVTAVKLADGAVITVKLADGAVTAAKLGSDVGSTILGDGSITTPKLADGAVNGTKLANFLQMDNGFYLTGNAGLGTIPHEGSGVGMMWYPKKLAFRSGWVTGTQWDDANVGFGSTALGKNTTASGPFSMALGMNASTLGLEGVFVYGDASQDNTSFLVTATAPNQFVVRAAGGFRFRSAPDLSTGCDISAGDLQCTGHIQTQAGIVFPDASVQTRAAGAAAGVNNTALGTSALNANTTGHSNTALGNSAMRFNTTGAGNTAMGDFALDGNTTGFSNTAVGRNSLIVSNGSGNIALGFQAGVNLTTGSSDIYIGNEGMSTESFTIRIGTGGTHTQTFIAGISGATSSGGAGVFVNSAGQLGTTTSSARAKEAVENVGEGSQRLMRLRPVQFRYKLQYDDGSRLTQYGLIAEEVAEVFPELVLYRPDGEIETVRYHLLAPLMLNEMQRQEKELVELRAQVARLEGALRALESPGSPEK